MDELRANRIFLAVARHRGFAAAARELSLTATAVTRSVAALEAHLGVQLLVRTTRQVSLTSAGAAYAARIEGLVEGFDSAVRELHTLHAPDRGRLRINAPMSFGTMVLPEVLGDFRRRYPLVEMNVTLTDVFVDILAGDWDLAIRLSETVEGRSTIWRKLCRVRRDIIAKPGTEEASATMPEAVPPEKRLGYSPDETGEAWQLSRAGERRTLEAGAAFCTNNGYLLARVVEAQGGVALLPRFIVRDAIREGRLVQALPGWSAPDLWLSLYYPPYEKLPPLVATFSDHFERHITVTQPISRILD